MKQIIQDLKSGETILEEIPVPQKKRGHVLIKTHRTLVSLGTERMLVSFGKASYLEKARQQPDKVKQVLDKIKSDGLRPTIETVMRKLNEPIPLGYCNAGEVIGVGAEVSEFKIGDRVVSNGNHAEVVNVPKNLVAKIPDSVSYDEASFTVIGAIALQGIRLINPSFGETVVVTGLGLIGLIAAQLLMANGCEVIGLDFDQQKVDLAQQWGVKAFNVGAGVDPVKTVEDLTNGIGADAVLITASTKSNDVISQAAKMSRKRGRIVLVGVIGLNIQRADFYNKELSFQVSCSYGPGRYDANYEEKGQDYPLPFVRWTEKRNFEAILSALAAKRLQVDTLISEKLKIEAFQEIYGDIAGSNSIATILEYPGNIDLKQTSVSVTAQSFAEKKGVLGIIGAGNFTKGMIVPMLNKLNASIKYIASSGGLSATVTAKKYKIANATTNYQDILKDPEVDAVLITTRHNSHAQQTLECIEHGKHVFIEKPLAMNLPELEAIEKAYRSAAVKLLVGFNRRFSPFAIDAKKQLGGSNHPISVIATMNAGFIPEDHWTQDINIGGGRIIGEACHLIDLITYFTGSKVEKIIMNAIGPEYSAGTDNASILLRYQNGSQGVINYFSNGHKAYSKERVEIYSQGKTMILDNFRKSHYYGFKSSGMSKSQDKGHYNQFKMFVENIKSGGPEIIPFDDILNTSRAAIKAVESLQQSKWMDVE